MNKNYYKISAIPAVLLVASLFACAPVSEKDYVTPGQPESLIQTSSERVSLDASLDTLTQTLTSWLRKDKPARIEASCHSANKECTRALNIAAAHQVEVMKKPVQGKERLVLVYERLYTKRCDPSYVSNHYNFRQLNHPAMGCATATNMLKMIGDPKQVTSPVLSAPADGAKAAEVVRQRYRAEPIGEPIF